MRLVVVAAVARNGVIGREGGIPWHIPEDLARFRALTTGHPVVMGRKTWDSLPDRFRPLPGRRNVVVTRNPAWSADGAERAASLEDALDLLDDLETVFVIGGASLYAEALPLADALELTEVELEVEGDAFFPAWDRETFEELSREVARLRGRHAVRVRHVPARFFAPPEDLSSRQLAALASVDALFEQAGIAYWLFGGWAVDFHAGRVTRPHDDVDVAVWHEDLPRIFGLLDAAGWSHAPEPDENGGTGYERDAVRLELTFLARDDAGGVVTPLRDGVAPWPEGAFGDDARVLQGVRARVLVLDALARGKTSPRADPSDATKDRADRDILSGLW